MGKVKVAFLWHQHQPYYKDLMTGRYILPWVRLHGIKDYYNMVKLLEDFPDIHQTINIVPSLMLQIEDYADTKEINDIYLQLTLKPAAILSDEEKAFILKNFFSINLDNVIHVYPRYKDLLLKRGNRFSSIELKDASTRFNTQDFLDLQVWFNLAWFDPALLKDDDELAELVRKGKDFSEDDKLILARKQKELLGKIVEKHRELFSKGQIDITTTPFYHPILPLLCDSDIARISREELNLPKKRFRHVEDARAQIVNAISFYHDRFASIPKGMWPAEGGVSNEAAALFAEAGIKWIASDENILAQSTHRPLNRDGEGNLLNPDLLYKPYLLRAGSEEIMVVFRDHFLSDLIGFTYSSWDPIEAAKDLVGRLMNPGRIDPSREYLVCIILDGENAWEFYKNNGRDFLRALYQMISEEPSLDAVTISEYLEDYPQPQVLDGIFPGSWIDQDFHVWIGGGEENLAWDYLGRSREDLVDFEKRQHGGPLQDQITKAWEEIYIAEGSDWFWWYGEEHNSEHDAAYDALFRKHLTNVYELIGMEIPDYLLTPIVPITDGGESPFQPEKIIKPTIDGAVTTYYEWDGAAIFRVGGSGATMHRRGAIIREVFFGFDHDNFYLRINPTNELKDKAMMEKSLELHLLYPSRIKVVISINPDGRRKRSEFFLRSTARVWQQRASLGTYCADQVIEIKIPLSELNGTRGEQIHLFFCLFGNDGAEIERIPANGSISLSSPTLDFESEMWSV